MKHFIIIVLSLFLLTAVTTIDARNYLHHGMKLTLKPIENFIQVEDTVILPDEFSAGADGKLHFFLHGGLEPKILTKKIILAKEKEKPQPEHLGINASSFALDESVPLEHYSVKLPGKTRTFVIQYQGKIYHPLQEQGEEYARSFRESPGLISDEGVFLAGATYWYPEFSDKLVTFTADVHLPIDWEPVMPGARTLHNTVAKGKQVCWDSPEPQDEIFLVAARFIEYTRAGAGVQAMVFLRNPDDALANKYLETTVQYLEMYRQLIGPYPYKKFALVENFWETGYGMPSFTLLGPKIIRFPFILHSSYPHEILHNWWGNSVFVDYPSGNWCEGLTAYLADHLIQEQRGTAQDYRRTTLQGYADYVAESRDLPLVEFRSRHSSATQAVGYGKSMMFFHMLRLQLGDELFTEGLRKFYRDYKFRQATFVDLEQIFSDVAKANLQPFFNQWINRTGAPELKVSQALAHKQNESFRLTAMIEQLQPGEPYDLWVPVAVFLENQETAFQTIIAMQQKQVDFTLELPARPLQLQVDPEFDLFRRLDRNEIPPALSQAFGAEKVLILLPSAAPEQILVGYQQLAQTWQNSQPGQVQIKLDSVIDLLPNDHAVWLFGRENLFQSDISAGVAEYDITINDTDIRIGRTRISRDDNSLVLVARHPGNPDLALTWVATANVAAMPGLGRKLPHYGKYSYLGFEGDEPTNIVKGQWPALKSPMSIIVQQPDDYTVGDLPGQLASRRALAYLPPVFSEERLVQDLHFLASPDLKGRGFGTPELDRAADYIAAGFANAGLIAAGDSSSFFQTWKEHGGKPEREVMLKNVVGIIPGTKTEWAGQSVVVGAHYDHLGLGWPDVHQGDDGKIHPGADDNASGVAVLLELARVLARNWQPDRTVVFVAFTGEEAGLRGSRYFVANEKVFPVNNCIGMLNIDTIGRLKQKKLTIFGTGSAREWLHIFLGAGFVTGVQVEPAANDPGSSDQKSFIEAGIPAVQFFSGPHADYHRPTDTVDKIDAAGLVKTAAVIKEAIEYLAARQEPLTSQLPAKKMDESANLQAMSPERRVSLGTVPDFTYSGTGFRISGVTPGSPAEKAGLLAGDVIIRINDAKIDDLRGFSNVLKTLQPGDNINITYLRHEKEHTISTRVVAR